MKEPILKVKNLNVKLDSEEIIKGLSFEVKEGDVLTILVQMVQKNGFIKNIGGNFSVQRKN